MGKEQGEQGVLEGPVGCLNVKETQVKDTDISACERAEKVTSVHLIRNPVHRNYVVGFIGQCKLSVTVLVS